MSKVPMRLYVLLNQDDTIVTWSYKNIDGGTDSMPATFSQGERPEAISYAREYGYKLAAFDYIFPVDLRRVI